MLLDALQHQPKMVLEWFGRHPKLWGRWLELQDYIIFGLLETGKSKLIMIRLDCLIVTLEDKAKATDFSDKNVKLSKDYLLHVGLIVSEIKAEFTP